MKRLIRELCTDDIGQLSNNKIWAHVAKLAATAVYLRQGLLVHPPPAIESLAWFTVAYVGIVGGSELAAKFMNLRWGGGGNARPPAATSQTGGP